AAATRTASALARTPAVERALARDDASAMRAIAARHSNVMLISSRGERAGSLAPLGVQRLLDVVSGGQTIGRIVTVAPLDSAFVARARASLPSHDLLAVTRAGEVARGPLPAGLSLAAPTPRNVHAGGRTYRALSSPLVSDRPGLQVVALAPAGTRLLGALRLPVALLAPPLAAAIVA